MEHFADSWSKTRVTWTMGLASSAVGEEEYPLLLQRASA
jgi:hypothetical protein